jgi:hypothetical protein
MSNIITLTTDFGTQDAYVAAMKGVILSLNPQVTIMDICHSIEPQNVAQATFVLSTACSYFPRGTIHVAVVDPGVGSQRRAILLKTPEALFIAPDNGVLSYVMALPAGKPVTSEEGFLMPQEKRLPPGFEAISLTNSRFWHHPVSSTFHGRDVFAPVAAHLSLGVPLEEFGERIGSILAIPVPHPQFRANGELMGHILHIDHFGNLITDVKREDLFGDNLSLEVAGRHIQKLSSSYAEGDELLALIGSSEQLEIAAQNGSAAKLLSAKVGDVVKIKRRVKL